MIVHTGELSEFSSCQDVQQSVLTTHYVRRVSIEDRLPHSLYLVLSTVGTKYLDAITLLEGLSSILFQ